MRGSTYGTDTELKSTERGGMQKEETVTGTVARIERFMIHDGPGIRTVVFMKGCPLRCMWCSSPQTWNRSPEVIWKRKKCIGCERCVEACPRDAIRVEKGNRLIDRGLCDGCGACTDVCPSGALQFDGMELTVEETVKVVMRDEGFYRKSGGGVTVSGGEPLLQHGFVKALLRSCKGKGVHAAMETSGFARWEIFRAVVRELDLLLIDVKHMDPDVHLTLTGRSNEVVLKNIERAAGEDLCRIVLRYPVIPGRNDSPRNVERLIGFMKKNGLCHIDIFPFHRLGEHEYDELGMEYPARTIGTPLPEQVEEIKGRFESEGLHISGF